MILFCVLRANFNRVALDFFPLFFNLDALRGC